MVRPPGVVPIGTSDRLVCAMDSTRECCATNLKRVPSSRLAALLDRLFTINLANCLHLMGGTLVKSVNLQVPYHTVHPTCTSSVRYVPGTERPLYLLCRWCALSQTCFTPHPKPTSPHPHFAKQLRHSTSRSVLTHASSQSGARPPPRFSVSEILTPGHTTAGAGKPSAAAAEARVGPRLSTAFFPGPRLPHASW